MNPMDRFREFRLGLAAMKDGHVVTLIDQGFDHKRADETGTADHENPHLRASTLATLQDPAPQQQAEAGQCTE